MTQKCAPFINQVPAIYTRLHIPSLKFQVAYLASILLALKFRCDLTKSEAPLWISPELQSLGPSAIQNIAQNF